MAGTGGNVETNDGNLNVPDDAAKEPATTIAALELTLETASGALDTGAELSRIPAIIVGSEFPRPVAMANAISSESEEDVPAVTTTDAADDEGEEVQAVQMKTAAKLLLVEHERTMTDSHRSRKNKRQHVHRRTGEETKHYTSKGKRRPANMITMSQEKQHKNSKRNTRKHQSTNTPNAQPSKTKRTCKGACIICKRTADR